MDVELACADVERIRTSRAYQSERGPDVDQYHHLINACRRVRVEGLWCEFGVSTGGSLWQLCGEAPGLVYGFDSFAGLPEAWEAGPGRTWPAGAFNGEPAVLRENARLVRGMFDDTIGDFFGIHDEPVALAHIDCDLYSSALSALNGIARHVVPGTVLIFDEIFNYANYAEHEMRALLEVARAYAWAYEYIGHVPQRAAASMIITAIGEHK